MDTTLNHLLDGVRADGTVVTVGLVDLDHFKRINDTQSHAVGDAVLRHVADLLQEAVEDVDEGLAARMGGEEFLLLLPGLDRSTAVALLERLRRRIAEYRWSTVQDGVTVTASIGVASAPEDELERSALSAHAYRSLYAD